MLARLRAMTAAEFAALPYGSEGLWQKVMHACRTEASLEGILAAVKSKRYPRTRLMRMLLCGFLGLTEQQLTEPAPYVRVLALYNEEGDIRPVKMEWEERWLDVDRVLDIRPAASLRSGGAGLRYTCSIAGVPTYLFLEETKWFFELAK